MIFQRALLLMTTGIVLAAPAAAADPATAATHPVTATPPLQVVPATPVSKNVQQRMRNCNGSADAKKLTATARETFIKSCMASHR
ncbi:MAG TPA: PsiF family protein, partial [Steroidobacteraceae bacterium]|nr:PsiF family protein [Steroidobacteraceae bacterium]